MKTKVVLLTFLLTLGSVAHGACDFTPIDSRIESSPIFRASSSEEAIARCEDAGWRACAVESYRGNFPCINILGGTQCSSWSYYVRGARSVDLGESEKRQLACKQVRDCRRTLRNLSGDERVLATQQAEEVSTVNRCR
jgi:hypothetical protein